MDENITDWTALHEFKGVNLKASFVLSWRYESGSLKLDTDVCLTPLHALYESPRRPDDECIMPALLEFPYCVRLDAAGRSSNDNAIKSLTGDLVHGRIDSLQRIGDGVYRIDGIFGTATIHSERPLLRLRTRPP